MPPPLRQLTRCRRSAEAGPQRWFGAAAQRQAAGGSAYALSLAGGPWGYKAWYEANGDLVVRVRRPPAIDPANPLRGRRIVIDPGHPPAGATGPTGLYEGDANLAIALPLAVVDDLRNGYNIESDLRVLLSDLGAWVAEPGLVLATSELAEPLSVVDAWAEVAAPSLRQALAVAV